MLQRRFVGVCLCGGSPRSECQSADEDRGHKPPTNLAYLRCARKGSVWAVIRRPVRPRRSRPAEQFAQPGRSANYITSRRPEIKRRASSVQIRHLRRVGLAKEERFHYRWTRFCDSANGTGIFVCNPNGIVEVRYSRPIG
jgi:hypothetical protein